MGTGLTFSQHLNDRFQRVKKGHKKKIRMHMDKIYVGAIEWRNHIRHLKRQELLYTLTTEPPVRVHILWQKKKS